MGRSHSGSLRYLWINNLDGKGDKQMIYGPTETALHILEAGRVHAPATQ